MFYSLPPHGGISCREVLHIDRVSHRCALPPRAALKVEPYRPLLRNLDAAGRGRAMVACSIKPPMRYDSPNVIATGTTQILA